MTFWRTPFPSSSLQTSTGPFRWVTNFQKLALLLWRASSSRDELLSHSLALQSLRCLPLWAASLLVVSNTKTIQLYRYWFIPPVPILSQWCANIYLSLDIPRQFCLPAIYYTVFSASGHYMNLLCSWGSVPLRATCRAIKTISMSGLTSWPTGLPIHISSWTLLWEFWFVFFLIHLLYLCIVYSGVRGYVWGIEHQFHEFLYLFICIICLYSMNFVSNKSILLFLDSLPVCLLKSTLLVYSFRICPFLGRWHTVTCVHISLEFPLMVSYLVCLEYLGLILNTAPCKTLPFWKQIALS